MLWTFHQAAFSLNLAAIGVALAGLGLAAVSSAVAPRWVGWTSCVGAFLLVATSVFAVAVVDGGPLAAALVGFLLWAMFVVVASVGLLRRG